MTNLSISYQNINRVDEGITTTDGVGRSTNGVCDLHYPIWIKKCAIKKDVLGHPTLSIVAQLPIVIAQLTYCGCSTYLLWSPSLHIVVAQPL